MLRNEGKLRKEDYMNKMKVVIAFLLLAFLAIGAIFAETLQCNDPTDGTITVTFLGNHVKTTYSGFNAQSFQVVVLLKNGGSDILTFTYPRGYKTSSSTSDQIKPASGPIEKIYRCDFITAYK
jgi:hypothetical protein